MEKKLLNQEKNKMEQRDNKGRFVKGHKINLGGKREPFSEEWKKNMGKSKEGKPLLENHCKKISKTRKRLFKEKKLKPSSSCFKKDHIVPKEWKQRISEAQKERTQTKEEIEKRISKIRKENHYNWQGGISKNPYDQNWTPAYRRAVRKRDNQVCMLCGIHREKLNQALCVHHINHNKKMSFEENGISLCQHCHIGIVHKDDKNEEERKNWIKLFQAKLAKLYSYQYSETGDIILEIKK